MYNCVDAILTESFSSSTSSFRNIRISCPEQNNNSLGKVENWVLRKEIVL